ncbi:efflux RND transporter permease subunit [Tsuneonella sp. CC-YZS046]|uniref:efflux RND transporter permease subunit n=1 Tax=Tsuneonella sp. CC-YZS046 TaxID=3042152 RepID=UPI002D76AE62|nr:efflux RND transporter permease subunit [Tsuneonella sp. CC-YZS046]WRO65907.1 efflux RND transporter permease subunit [Tsuneonella sp. CC-YZS046]
MGLRNISAWSIRNPVVPIILFIGLMIAGIVSFSRMDVNDMPDIDFPAVTVTVVQPGAAPSEITTQITEKVEAAVRSISGVDEIQSTASEGNSLTIVQFVIGTDPNDAVNEVKNAVDQIRSDLPEGILEPQITKVEAGGGPIGYFAVSADDMTMEQLSWFVDDTIARRLLGITGMAAVSRGGGVDREIRVMVDPARMQSLGVTAAQVNDVLRQVNVDAAGGRAEIAGSRQSVRVLGNAADAYNLSNTRISLGNGRTIKLSDVAQVSDSYSEQTSIAKLKGRQVVTFSLQRAKGASDVTVYDAAMEEMAKIKAENPGVSFTSLFTTVNYTKGQYASSLEAMVEGAILAVIVVFFFLRDWRATIISAIAIPLSAIPTFWFMDLMGFSLNSLSLLALSLVAGVLVDDAIVEIENIVRHMRMGKSAYQAAIDAADEIGLAVVATTFSIVAVFLPVGLMPGISGQFFKNFGLSVVAAVLMSLAVARMVTPMVAAYFLKAQGEASHGEGRMMDRYMQILRWSLDQSRAEAYRARTADRPGLLRSLGARLRDHRVWMLGVGVGALVLTGLLMGLIPQQFQPNADQDWSQAKIEMVPGTTLEQTEAVSDEVIAVLEKQPEVARVIGVVREAGADLYITLSEKRDAKSYEFERRLTPQLQDIADARVSFVSQSDGVGSGRDITVMLTGSDSELLEKTAHTLVGQMRGIRELVAPRLDADLKRPELVIVPRFDLAAQLGVTTAALSQTIRIATMGEIDQAAAKFSLSDRQVPIRVILPKYARRDIATIKNLPVPTASGASVPLKRVAEIRFGAGPTQIQRYNQARRVIIGADLADGAVAGPAEKKIQQLPIMRNLPPGVGTAPVGEAKWQGEMIQNFINAVISGIFLVFAVLVLLYKRFVSPLVNMTSLLLAPLGGLIAIALIGQPISISVYIGILMLLGIVAKNSILLIDFAIEEMEKGVPKLEAILDAGHKRAQPIVMTTVAMTAGMVPTAISLSGDGSWRAPMGTTVIGGLILSTMLTLLIVPAGFSLADGFEKRIGPGLRRRFLTYRPGDAEPRAPAQPAE